MVRAATVADAPALAVLHGLAFDHPWSAAEITDLLASGAVGLMTVDGFILVREAAGEAEILTLAVAPEARRQGMGQALVEAAIARLGPAELFLEVAADNDAAIALYKQAGFAQAGVRRGYYPRPGGRVDALLLKRG
jgi:ribosomal-protein-alanine N-acetyltransferase